MRKVGKSVAVLAAAAGIAVAASCSNSTSPGLTAADLAGNYVLDSLTITGTGTLKPPAETGTLALTTTTYILTLTGGFPQADNGTYTINGNNYSQTSAVTSVQSTGTATLVNGILTVAAVAGGVASTSVWTKQ